jgi:formylglycine-generating enzyme required for sulfatase activity
MFLGLIALTVRPPEPFIEKLAGSAVEFKMVPVAGGKIKLGDKTVEVKPFYIASTETTWEVFDAYLLSGEPSKPYDQTKFAPDAIARPSRSYHLPDLGWGHKGYPVINISDETAEMCCRWLSSVTKKKYRLPSEAEWELAARGGTDADVGESDIAKQEWCRENSDEKTNAVGKKIANGFGLFDMLGNVGEWGYDLAGKPVLCGGDFQYPAAKVKASLRRYYDPDWQMTDPQIPKSRWWLSDGSFAGFRVVCDVP